MEKKETKHEETGQKERRNTLVEKKKIRGALMMRCGSMGVLGFLMTIGLGFYFIRVLPNNSLY